MVAKLLGELYNYVLIDSIIIFDALYMMLFFGNFPPYIAYGMEAAVQAHASMFLICLKRLIDR
tara:strand:+ start:262 stop:450 length:189 start_codon:yes stop_codon:yes gene_type:complete